MSPAEIAAWTGFGAMLVSAMSAAVSAVVLLRTNAVKADVAEVKHATNSLTDRLVATTKTEAHAAGLKEGRDERN